jgi:hypothetical protein
MADRHGNVLPAGLELEGYRIGPVLGAGGFGITYKAHDIRLDRSVAIKEYMPRHLAMRDADGSSVRPISGDDRGAYEGGLKAFEREGRTLVKFRHPNIVPALKLFDAHGTAYLVMDYVEGESLLATLKSRKTLPEAALRAILGPLLDGLETVYANGYVHRDIKPGNIFIRAEDGSPVLLDFGAARQALGTQTKALTSIVTPGYAPIEQYSEQAAQGPWTDIYALGATLYRAATGIKPPDAPDRAREDAIVPMAGRAAGRFSAAFLSAIDAALALQPEDRPQSVTAWRAMFGDRADASVETRIPSRPPQSAPHRNAGGRNGRTRRIAAGIAAAAVVAALAIGWLLTGPWFGATPPARSAGIEIRGFAVADRRSEMVWLKNKIERNLVELFNKRGMTVRSAATVNRMLPANYHAIVGKIDRIDDDVSVSVTLLAPDRTVVSSTELSGPFAVLRRIYKVIPETLIYGLDVHPRRLTYRKSKERPSASLLAYAHYLMARRAMRRKKPAEARALLLEAIGIDGRFAMAVWSIGQIERAAGNAEKAKEWEAKAQAIDLDHPRWPFTASAAAAKILPPLMAALRRGKVETLAEGLQYRHAALTSDRITLHAWTFALDRYAPRVVTMPGRNGGSVAAFAKAHGALVAINGGFFDIDARQRLSTSGLLVVDGVRLGEATGKGGSGVLLRRGAALQIVWRSAATSLSGIDDALQSGPVIVEPGGKLGIRSNSFNRLPRSAICLTPGHFTLVAVAGGVSLYELAKVLAARRKDGGFACEVALNLDGGPSTQAIVTTKKSRIHVKGLWKVHNAIVVRRR